MLLVGLVDKTPVHAGIRVVGCRSGFVVLQKYEAYYEACLDRCRRPGTSCPRRLEVATVLRDICLAWKLPLAAKGRHKFMIDSNGSSNVPG